jgi:uncharacterized protein YqgC (DUF456 family)
MLLSDLHDGFRLQGQSSGGHRHDVGEFLFILIGVVEPHLPETMLIAWAATLFQSFWKSKTRPMPVQILFNVSNVAIATMAAYYAYHT